MKSARNLMKKVSYFFLLFASAKIMANPSFTIGSNYYLTIFAYPHDILKWPNRGVFFYYNPLTLPWQGDVTNIHNRPSESYVSNYQDVEFAPPHGYSGNPNDVRSWIKVSSYVYQSTYTIGGLYSTNIGKLYIEIGKTTMDMELSAQGVGRAEEEHNGTSEYHLVPFEGNTNAGRDHYDIKLIYANRLFNNPFGLKIRYVQKSSEIPTGYVKFTKEGNVFEAPHLTWGWSTSNCNQIFGYSHINTDAWYQNHYILYNGYQMDVQMSYEYKGNYKTGIRYRRIRDDGDMYEWRYDEGSDFEGDYHVDSFWNHQKAMDLIRGYSKVRFWRIGSLDLGVLFFGEYASNPIRLLNKITTGDPALELLDKSFAVEMNPYFNYTFKRGYIDFGLLLEYSYAGMKNVSPRWNPMSQSEQKDVLWDSSPYSGWSPSWELFSEGSQWFFATGFESYSSINILTNLSLLARLTFIKKYAFIDKLYGTSEIPDGGNVYKFSQTHRRDTDTIETWMTGSVGIVYRLGPVIVFGTFQLPLAYLARKKTELRKDQELLFEYSLRNTWQVQQPTTIQILFVLNI
jgi:hypothetical protein